MLYMLYMLHMLYMVSMLHMLHMGGVYRRFAARLPGWVALLQCAIFLKSWCNLSPHLLSKCMHGLMSCCLWRFWGRRVRWAAVCGVGFFWTAKFAGELLLVDELLFMASWAILLESGKGIDTIGLMLESPPQSKKKIWASWAFDELLFAAFVEARFWLDGVAWAWWS